MDDLEALEIGLEKEYAAYDFYTRVADTVDDSKTRNLLHELAGEERGHINLLLRGRLHGFLIKAKTSQSSLQGS